MTMLQQLDQHHIETPFHPGLLPMTRIARARAQSSFRPFFFLPCTSQHALVLLLLLILILIMHFGAYTPLLGV
jgi:hypothetical protein